MLWRRERAIAQWRAGHRPSRRYERHRRALKRSQRLRIFHLASSIKILVILLLAFYALRLPAVGSLPKADVLMVDMTGLRDDSRNYLYNLLEGAGLSYVNYNSMGVDDLRLMTTGSYRFVVLWGHSGMNDMATSESYSPFYHVFEQLTGQLGEYDVGGKKFFSLQPGFIDGLVGRFQGTVVLLMGCNTLTQTDLAQAFIDKGASAVIGWRGLVTVQVTETAVASLVQRVLMEHQTTGQAVSETSGLLGTDTGLSAYASY